MKAHAAAALLAASASPSFAAPSLRRHDPDDQEGPGARALQGEEVAPGGEAPDPEARALQAAGIDFSWMFSWCGYEQALHPSYSEIAQGTDFNHMFYHTDLSSNYCCGYGPHYSLYHWDVSRGTDFSYMFTSSGNIGNLDLSRWDISSGTSFVSMFHNTNVHNVDFWNWDIVVERASDVSQMFAGATVKQAPWSCPRVKMTGIPVGSWPGEAAPYGPGPWDGFVRYCPGLCPTPEKLQWYADWGHMSGMQAPEIHYYATCQVF